MNDFLVISQHALLMLWTQFELAEFVSTPRMNGVLSRSSISSIIGSRSWPGGTRRCRTTHLMKHMIITEPCPAFCCSSSAWLGHAVAASSCSGGPGDDLQERPERLIAARKAGTIQPTFSRKSSSAYLGLKQAKENQRTFLGHVCFLFSKSMMLEDWTLSMDAAGLPGVL